MSPLQMLRACLHALSDPAAGLGKGLAMQRDEAASKPIFASCSSHPPSVQSFRDR